MTVTTLTVRVEMTPEQEADFRAYTGSPAGPLAGHLAGYIANHLQGSPALDHDAGLTDALDVTVNAQQGRQPVTTQDNSADAEAARRNAVAVWHLFLDSCDQPVSVSPASLRNMIEQVIQDDYSDGPECTCPAARDSRQWHAEACNVWADKGASVLAYEADIAATTAEIYRTILRTLR